MRQIRFISLVVFWLLLTGSQAVHGVTIDFNPAGLNPTVGDTFSVDLVISGSELQGYGELGGTGTGNDLSTFDLNVNFDPAVLTFNSYTLGDQLGIIPDDADDLSSGVLGGVINLSEVSLLFDLNAQPDSFTLAALSFTAKASGNTTLSISDIVLGDYFGDSLNLENNPSLDLTIKQGQGTPVPEPAAFMLFGIGLLGLLKLNRKL